MLSLSEIASSRYLLHRGPADAGFPAAGAAPAVDALPGPGPLLGEEAPLDDQADEWHPELGPFEPGPDDLEWSAGLPSDEDLEAMARHAAWRDHLGGPARVTDRDIVAAGSPPGQDRGSCRAIRGRRPPPRGSPALRVGTSPPRPATTTAGRLIAEVAGRLRRHSFRRHWSPDFSGRAVPED
jgi:hypothetical protein